MEVTKISMEEVEVSSIHEHPLIPFTRFDFSECKRCRSSSKYCIYGGYRCNEPGCEVVFHKECAKLLQEINHSSHPDHSLKLINLNSEPYTCALCAARFRVGYCCSVCDFKLDLGCARRPIPLVLPENSYGHKHPLKLSHEAQSNSRKMLTVNCKVCDRPILSWKHYYKCYQCEFLIHLDCVEAEAYHTSHPQHPLKSLECEAPDYADKKCLLCATEFDRQRHHHCDVCNFSICNSCMRNPPPLRVESPKTHEHHLRLLPRLIDFTCNACGTKGDRSPYFCRKCNFMIHRECIDLPRVININRHDHRISYTRRLGHGKWKCGVCRKNVVGFYGAYSCSKCSNYVVHSRCATTRDVWDMVECEGTPEEEVIAPFERIDDNNIKHFSHDHNLGINKDGRILHENIVCVACVLQICSEPFYSCKECGFILHEKCANLPRKKRHPCHNQQFTLHTDSHNEVAWCFICNQLFTGFRYESFSRVIDVRCGSISDSLVHESHPHPLYYFTYNLKHCNGCGNEGNFSCDDCDFSLDYKCAILPKKVMRFRYNDHPLFLSNGERSVDGHYWCEACEAEVNPEEWFYTCNECGVILHILCVVGDFSYIMPGSAMLFDEEVIRGASNTSTCRPVCYGCYSRCKLSSILHVSKDGVDVYFCSAQCFLESN